MDFDLLKQLQNTKSDKLPSFLKEQYISYSVNIVNEEYEILIPEHNSGLFEKWFEDCTQLKSSTIKNITHQLNGMFKKI